MIGKVVRFLRRAVPRQILRRRAYHDVRRGEVPRDQRVLERQPAADGEIEALVDQVDRTMREIEFDRYGRIALNELVCSPHHDHRAEIRHRGYLQPTDGLFVKGRPARSASRICGNTPDRTSR